MFETFDLYEELIKNGFVPTLFLRWHKRTKKTTIGVMSDNEEVYSIATIPVLQQMWFKGQDKHWIDIKEVEHNSHTFDAMEFK